MYTVTLNPRFIVLPLFYRYYHAQRPRGSPAGEVHIHPIDTQTKPGNGLPRDRSSFLHSYVQRGKQKLIILRA